MVANQKSITDHPQLPGLPPLPKKRGRPSTGSAKTSAERKRDQRRRDLQRFGRLEESEMTLTGLLEAYSFSFKVSNPDACISIAKVLIQRAEALKAKLSDSHDNINGV